MRGQPRTTGSLGNTSSRRRCAAGAAPGSACALPGLRVCGRCALSRRRAHTSSSHASSHVIVVIAHDGRRGVQRAPVLEAQLQQRVRHDADAHLHLVQLMPQLLDGSLDPHDRRRVRDVGPALLHHALHLLQLLADAVQLVVAVGDGLRVLVVRALHRLQLLLLCAVLLHEPLKLLVEVALSRRQLLQAGVQLGLHALQHHARLRPCLCDARATALHLLQVGPPVLGVRVEQDAQLRAHAL
mmetsp:Transcript_37025/g.109137  ORF Transcript_37025/g.109137 Transcript_37025/m.109137 type:complete len:241 (-) Transcript_37025:981-1703(-)